MNVCQNSPELTSRNVTAYNEFVTACLKYSEQFNIIMKDFQNKTNEYRDRIMQKVRID